MKKNNICRQDRSEGCPGDMLGGRSPEKAASDRLKKILTVDRTVPTAVLLTGQAVDLRIEYQTIG